MTLSAFDIYKREVFDLFKVVESFIAEHLLLLDILLDMICLLFVVARRIAA